MTELRDLINQAIARHGDGEIRLTYEGAVEPIADLYRGNPRSEDLPPFAGQTFYLLEAPNDLASYRAAFEHPDDREPLPAAAARPAVITPPIEIAAAPTRGQLEVEEGEVRYTPAFEVGQDRFTLRGQSPDGAVTASVTVTHSPPPR